MIPARHERSFPARSWAVALTLLVVCALAVRLAAVAVTPHLALASDASDYARHARSIAAGHGYPPSTVAPGGPSAIRPPAYPYLLGAVYWISGNRLGAGRALQAVLGAVGVLLTALIARQVWGRLVGLTAGVFAALFPPLVIGGMTLLSEPLFVVFELAAVLAVLRSRGRNLSWLALGGAFAGLSILTRSNGVLLLLALAPAARPVAWRTLAAWRPGAVLLGCAVLVVLPWTVRNAIELRAVVPVSDQDGYTLAGTYNQTSRALDGMWIVATIDPYYARLVGQSRSLTEVALDAKLRSAARRFALAHPLYLGTVALHNTLRLLNLGGARYEREVAAGDYGLGPHWALLMTYGLFPFLALAVAGLMTTGARQAPRWLWGVPAVMFTTVLVLATNRFRAAIDPFILMLAALAAIALVQRVRAAGRSG